MTTTFIASNGDTIETRPDGYLVVKYGGLDDWVAPRTADALREHFQHRRDAELGRWRSKNHPDYVVYPVEGKTREVRVANEATGVSRSYRDHPDYLEANSQIRTLVAREYFAAHPEKKPWHDAKSGELWLLTIDGEQVGALAWRPAPGLQFETATGTLRYDDPDITAGRRIWPEETDDE